MAGRRVPGTLDRIAHAIASSINRANALAVLFLVLYIFLGTALWTVYFDDNYPEITASELRASNGEVASVFHAGHTLHIFRVYCFEKATLGRVTVEIRNIKTGAFYTLGTRLAVNSTNCSPRTTAVGIPSDTPPGQYELHEIASYSVNPLKMTTYTFPILRFTLLTANK